MKIIDWSFEERIWKQKRNPAGIDEAGRGPIAGPVVAAAVILNENKKIGGINDSKQLTDKKRRALYKIIRENSLSHSVGIVDPDEIDRINILRAAIKAMKLAVEGLKVKPDFLYIDGNMNVPSLIEQEALVKGDTRCYSIAAASIIAKVTRDIIMEDLHELYPQYNFRKHKGYPTKEHYNAIRKFGPSPVHRRTFRGVING